jgi:hypothetical protein
MRPDFFIKFAATATSLERNRTFQRERNSPGADLVRDLVTPSNRIGLTPTSTSAGTTQGAKQSL